MTTNTNFKSNRYGVILISIYLIGIHTYIRVPITQNIELPAFLSIVSGVLLMAKNNRMFVKNQYWYLLSFIFYALLSLLYGYMLDGELYKRATALIYLVISIHIAYAFYLETRKFSAVTIERIFLAMSVIILIGAFAEVYLGFSAVTEWFRRNFLIGYMQSDYIDVRDMAVYGKYRARFFTAEPSHLAKTLLMSSFLWLSFSKIRFKFIVYAVIILIGLVLIMSPVLLIALPNAIIIYLYQGKQRISIKKLLVAVLIFLAVLLLLYASRDYLYLTERLKGVFEGSDDSVLIRLFAPPLIAMELISQNLFFGYGISGIDAHTTVTADVLYILGVGESVIALDRVTTNIYNSFWNFWISFGFVIGTLQIFLLKKVLTANRIHLYGFFFMNLFLYSYAMSNINTIRFWTIFFVLMLAQYGLKDRVRLRTKHFYIR